jgi:amidase
MNTSMSMPHMPTLSFAEYEEFDATALAGLIRTREISAQEVLDAAIDRIERLNPTLNAVVHKFYDQGRAAIAKGLPDGLFTGVPLLLKNTGAAVAGTPLTGGSRLTEDVVSPQDGTLAHRYKAAGLVLIGKTNTPEFALSFATEPTLYGATRNPWDLTRGPGGSSGGSSAAVAAGMVPMAHASDGAGSTRVPAAHCGLFGFKPSRIRNPMGPDIAEGIAGMATPHALSRSVRDNATLLDVSHGPDVGDPYAAPPPARPFREELGRPLGPLKIGLMTRSPLGTPVDPQCAATARAAAGLCASLGHHVKEAELEFDAAGLKHAWRVIAGVGLAQQVDLQAKRRGLADWRAYVQPVNAEWAEEGWRWSGADYMRAVTQLHRTARALGRFFQQFDMFLSPTVAELPPVLGQMAGTNMSLDQFYDQFWQHAPFTCAFNAAGCPAMSVPLGQSKEGLPIGAHFGARFGDDGLLFALAGQLEQAKPWFSRRPAFHA